MRWVAGKPRTDASALPDGGESLTLWECNPLRVVGRVPSVMEPTRSTLSPGDTRFEVLPLGRSEEEAARLPEPVRLSVTCSPRHGYGAPQAAAPVPTYAQPRETTT